MKKGARGDLPRGKLERDVLIFDPIPPVFVSRSTRRKIEDKQIKAFSTLPLPISSGDGKSSFLLLLTSCVNSAFPYFLLLLFFPPSPARWKLPCLGVINIGPRLEGNRNETTSHNSFAAFLWRRKGGGVSYSLQRI